MKITLFKSSNRTTERISYPNAISRREALNRLLDALVAAASGFGITAILMLMMALS